MSKLRILDTSDRTVITSDIGDGKVIIDGDMFDCKREQETRDVVCKVKLPNKPEPEPTQQGV